MKDVIRKWWVALLVITGVVVITVGVLLLFLLVHKPASTTASSVQTSVQQTVAALPHNERQVVTSYNQALVKQDWTTIYASTAQSVLGSDSQEQFAQTMEQQVQSQGSISSITVTSEPEIKTSSGGMIYFTVFETVALNQQSTTRKLTIVSVFILENAKWKYFTSKSV